MTEEEKQQLIIEIQNIPTNSDVRTHHIGQFTLYDGTTFNSLTEEQREEKRKQIWDDFNKMYEQMQVSTTAERVIERCKRDRRFYEDLLMRLDEGVLFPG